jgi:hypothetical protein
MLLYRSTSGDRHVAMLLTMTALIILYVLQVNGMVVKE